MTTKFANYSALSNASKQVSKQIKDLHRSFEDAKAVPKKPSTTTKGGGVPVRHEVEKTGA